MKRSTRLFIGFVAAALTYGSLMAFVGPQHGGRHGFSRYHSHNGHGRYHCGDQHRGNESKSGQTPHRPENPSTEKNNSNQ